MIGQPYESIFKMEPDPQKKKGWRLERVKEEEVIDFVSTFQEKLQPDHAIEKGLQLNVHLYSCTYQHRNIKTSSRWVWSKMSQGQFRNPWDLPCLDHTLP